MSPDLEHLVRWIDAGGAWEVTDAGAGWVEVELLTCGRDEVMGHLRTDAADVLAFVTGSAER